MSKYNVGDKFAIEIKELVNGSNGEMFYKSDCCSIIFGEEQLDKLQKYEQPTISEDTLEMVRMKALNEGRNEVWELAKKIVLNQQYGGLSIGELKKIFGFGSPTEILMRYTLQETLEKLEAYEKEQNEIKVGDVLKARLNGMKCVVSSDKGCNGFVLTFSDGSGSTEDLTFIKQNYKKTGKHIDIQSILQQIGGTE